MACSIGRKLSGSQSFLKDEKSLDPQRSAKLADWCPRNMYRTLPSNPLGFSFQVHALGSVTLFVPEYMCRLLNYPTNRHAYALQPPIFSFI
jgi:hypothetical protein